MIDFLAARAIAGVEVVDAGCYRRTIAIDGAHGTIEVRAARRDGTRSRRRSAFPNVRALPAIIARIRRVFDLGADVERDRGAARRGPAAGAAGRGTARAARAGRVGRLRARGARGARPADHGDARARRLAGKLVAALRRAARAETAGDGDRAQHRVFPRPERLAAADLATLGMPRARAATLSALAAAAAADPRLFEREHDLDERDRAAPRACPGSASGRRSTSRCARSASPTRFPPPTSACCAPWPTPTARADAGRSARARRSVAAVARLRGAASLDRRPARARRRRRARARGGGGMTTPRRCSVDRVASPLGTCCWSGTARVHLRGARLRGPRGAHAGVCCAGTTVSDALAVRARRAAPITDALGALLRRRTGRDRRHLAVAHQRERRSSAGCGSRCAHIPAGTTVSYGAARRGASASRRASRAVGLANGANPIGDRRAVPSRHRQRRLAHRLRRRPRAQALAPRARARLERNTKEGIGMTETFRDLHAAGADVGAAERLGRRQRARDRVVRRQGDRDHQLRGRVGLRLSRRRRDPDRRRWSTRSRASRGCSRCRSRSTRRAATRGTRRRSGDRSRVWSTPGPSASTSRTAPSSRRRSSARRSRPRSRRPRGSASTSS